jgi:DNA-binding NarL/FixJ family response regulator
MTRVLLADDHELMREALRLLLTAQPNLEIVGEAADGVKAVRLALELQPDIVIMDVAMPHMNGIEATRRLTAELPRTKVIALSTHMDRLHVAEMLRAGAAGYVLKQGAFRELALAVAAVQASQIYLSPRIASVVVDLVLCRPSRPV